LSLRKKTQILLASKNNIPKFAEKSRGEEIRKYSLPSRGKDSVEPKMYSALPLGGGVCLSGLRGKGLRCKNQT
jgi:hypothetical protein